MSDLVVFDFGGRKVRTAGTPEAPLFCAADVCSAMEIDNTSQACARLDQDEQELVYVEHTSGRKQALFVTESGLYSLILASRKPEAREFKRWVTSVVLPTIRKTGQYIAKPMSQAEIIAASANLLVSIERTQAEHEIRLANVETIQAKAAAEVSEALELPPAPVEASERTYGQMSVALLRAWGLEHSAFDHAYRALYQAVLERPETRVDLRARLDFAKGNKERGKPAKRLSDIIDASGKSAEIYAIARQLFATARRSA